uniref:Uncharacterized protein n=1 Tax=Avena sativa TaxID=4498 RepID=A0ACD5VBY7_AVESA
MRERGGEEKSADHGWTGERAGAWDRPHAGHESPEEPPPPARPPPAAPTPPGAAQPQPGDADHAERIKELAGDLFKVYFIGIEAGARMLASCLKLAAERGARLAVNLAFAAMPDERLHDALLAQRLPARPTTQTEAFSRVEATFNSVKTDPSDPAPATVVDLDKARDYLDRACALADLAVKHIDLAVVVISRFIDPKKVASLAEITDKHPYISEDGPYPSD